MVLGLFPKALQRQVLAWWSAGSYDLIEPSRAEEPQATVDDLELQVVRVMKERSWSRKEAGLFLRHTTAILSIGDLVYLV